MNIPADWPKVLDFIGTPLDIEPTGVKPASSRNWFKSNTKVSNASGHDCFSEVEGPVAERSATRRCSVNC
jgi:hypothetical protein